MAHAARAEPNAAGKFTTERFFRLVSEGALSPDDRVELLEGWSSPWLRRTQATPWPAIWSPRRSAARSEAGRPSACNGRSSPGGTRCPSRRRCRPGCVQDYAKSHPTTALLIVEVAEWSLPQDRLTKAAIYAGTSVPEYWIVNLRDDQVECCARPTAGMALPGSTHRPIW